MKRLVSLVLVLVLAVGLAATIAEGIPEAKSDAFAGKVLRIAGPGGIASAKPDSTVHVDGSYRPGYNELIAAFKENYPGVTVEFTPATWTDWKAFLQTTAAGESADILLHGAMISDICYDLTGYLEKDPWLLDYLASKPEQYRADEENYTTWRPTGVSYTCNPYYALIDLRILDHYGVKAPEANWTWNDLMEIAKATTGTDPVTGKETFGCYPFKHPGEIHKPFSSYLASQGIKNMHYKDYKWDVETSFASDENVAALEFFTELCHLAPKGFVESLGRDKYASAENDIAVLLSENMISDLRRLVKDGITNDFLMLPLPINEKEAEAADSTYSSYCGTASIAIAYNAKEPDLAWEFIKWLITDEHAQQWLIANNNGPVSYYGIDMLTKQYPQYPSFANAFKKVMENFWDNFSIDQFDRVDASMADLAEIFSNYFVELLKGTIDAKTMGASVDADFNETKMMNHK